MRTYVVNRKLNFDSKEFEARLRTLAIKGRIVIEFNDYWKLERCISNLRDLGYTNGNGFLIDIKQFNINIHNQTPKAIVIFLDEKRVESFYHENVYQFDYIMLEESTEYVKFDEELLKRLNE